MNFLALLNPYVLPKSRKLDDVLAVQREVMLQFAFYLLLLLATVGIGLALFNPSSTKYIGIITVFIVAYLFLVALTVLRNLPYALRAAALVTVFYGIGLYALITNGTSGSGILMMALVVVLANLFFKPIIGSSILIITVVTIVWIAVRMITGLTPAPALSNLIDASQGTAWVLAGIVFLLGAALTTMSFWVLTNGLQANVAQQQRLTKQLEEEQASLEQRVQSRAADLQNRLAQYEVASEIAREISKETNLQVLLEKTVNLVQQQFHFYHAGIFLNDDRNEYTVLRAATGQAGQQMIERNHRLRIGEIGIVGNVANKGEARIAMDVTDDILHYKNPLLPNTRSEMALPLKFGNQTIGALDVQSTLENAFSQQDIKILQTVADQMAIALARSQQVDQLQHSLQELEAGQAQIIRQNWQGHLKTAGRKLSYHYQNDQIENTALESAHGKQAISTGQSVMAAIEGSESSSAETVLAIPIKLRSQVLGVIDIHFQGASVSPDLVALIEGAVDRLAVSLENARLLEEIQYRAERERLVGEISAQVRTASDVDSILRIAAQEIGRSLGVSEVMVQLRRPEQV